MADTIIQRSFASGEVAPALFARVDQARYATGLRTMRNFITQRAGGAQNRPGTTFVAEVKNSSLPVRLIPFIISTSPASSFVLEFGDHYMRVHQNGIQQPDGNLPKTITAVTKANPAVVTIAGHGWSNGDEINIQGCIGMVELNNRNYRIAGVTTNTFTLTDLAGNAVDSTGFGTFVAASPGDLPQYPNAVKVFELATPYGWADLSGLRYVQSNDVLTIVHPSYAPRKLSYSGTLGSFAFSTYTFAPSIAAPTSLGNTQSGGTGTKADYVVTAVAADGSESQQSASTTSASGTPTSAAPVTLTWAAPTLVDAQTVAYYNVYRKFSVAGTPYTAGSYCHIGISQSTTYIDDGHAADLSTVPPISQTLFGSSLNYPSTVAYFQGRLVFASTIANPETVWASVSGDYPNFSTHVISEDDDMVQFTMSSRQLNPIKHLVDLNRLLVLTSAGEYMVAGNGNGVLTPSGVNPVQQSYYGSSDLQPIPVGNSALYVQARGAIVRDIGFEFYVNGYRGTDLTVFSTHLFDGYTLTDWAYQQIPGYNVWCVRSDGKLLGLTYIKEQEMAAWHRHDTNGHFENVACVPEGYEDAVYFVVNRTTDINHPRRYIERMASRSVSDNKTFCYTDSSRTVGIGSTVNGVGATTLALSGGTAWDYTETLTLTAVPDALLFTGFFDPTMVGDAFQIEAADDSVIRFTVTAYVSPTVVQGTVSTTVPVDLRNTATTAFAHAVKKISGLWHLEGRKVSVLGDGYVVASPNNSAYPVYTVANGCITLDQPYAVISAGLPYLSDLETLDFDVAQGESINNKKMIVNELTLRVDSSRGIWVGGKPPTDDSVNALEGLTEAKVRDSENYGEPVALTSHKLKINLQSSWSSNGRVVVRQSEPLPLTVLSISPSGMFPIGGQ